MISRDELIKFVAQSCGISVEISSYFFEVFVNRLGNKLKPGDLLHFQDFGFFHKRNCRIQIEKTSDSPFPKSYLVQLVLFSSEMKIRSDLADIHFLKIPNLKTLWADDKEFQKSLNAGDFSPYTERNQLIKSFATKAEIIISGWRKDYDHDLVEELIIPLSFDLNFLVKSGQKTSPAGKISDSRIKSEQQPSGTAKAEKSEDNKTQKAETADDRLPWNYSKKFLETQKNDSSQQSDTIQKKSENIEQKIISTEGSDLRKEQQRRLSDFQPVSSHHDISKTDVILPIEAETVKYNVSATSSDATGKTKGSKEFTEVKSRSESYRQGGRFDKQKKSKYDKYTRTYPGEKPFTDRKNFLPLVAVLSFLIIVLLVVYIYFIKDDSGSSINDNVITSVTPPANVNVVNRDFKIAVTYPYPKMENRIELSGFSNNIFSGLEVNTETTNEQETGIKPEPRNEKVVEQIEKPKVEEKKDKPLSETQKPVTEVKKVESNNIFLYKGFYVVHIGTYKSEEAADQAAERFFDLGYNAFVQVTENRDGERIYTLNVGDFTSEEFARQFIEKNIK